MSKKKYSIRYDGETPIEIGIGEFRAKAAPGETFEVESLAFRNELLGIEGFSDADAGDKEDEMTESRLMRRSKKDLLAIAAERNAGATEDNNKEEIVAKILATLEEADSDE